VDWECITHNSGFETAANVGWNTGWKVLMIVFVVISWFWNVVALFLTFLRGVSQRTAGIRSSLNPSYLYYCNILQILPESRTYWQKMFFFLCVLGQIRLIFSVPIFVNFRYYYLIIFYQKQWNNFSFMLRNYVTKYEEM